MRVTFLVRRRHEVKAHKKTVVHDSLISEEVSVAGQLLEDFFSLVLSHFEVSLQIHVFSKNRRIHIVFFD